MCDFVSVSRRFWTLDILDLAITRTELTRSTEHNGAGLSFCVDVALIRAKRNHNGHGKRTGDRRIWYSFGVRKPHHGNDYENFYRTFVLLLETVLHNEFFT